MLNERISKSSALGSLQLFDQYATRFSHVNLATTLYRVASYAKTNNSVQSVLLDERIGHLLALAADNIEGFDMQSLCHIVVAIAKLNVPQGSHSLLELAAMVLNMKDQKASFKAGDLSNIAWAYSKACSTCPELKDSPIIDTLFENILKASVESVERFKPVELSSLCWSFAKAEKPADPIPFFNAVANRLTNRRSTTLSKFEAKSLANMLWAFGAANFKTSMLFSMAAETLTSNPILMRVSFFFHFRFPILSYIEHMM